MSGVGVLIVAHDPVGSALLGVVYDYSVLGVAVLSLVLQLMALPVLLVVASRWSSR